MSGASPVTSAARLLECARGVGFNRNDAMIFAVAGDILESSQPGQSFEAARRMWDPALAFLIATAGEARALAGRRGELARLASAVPPDRRVEVLGVAEGLLAQVDPVWAWSLMQQMVDGVALPSLGLGLVIAAYADRAGLTNLPPAQDQLPDFYRHQFVADQVARLAVRGEIRGRQDPAFSRLQETSSGWSLLPSEAVSYLVAAAAVDAKWALEIADSMLQVYPSDRLAPALTLLAAAAVSSTIGQQVINRVNRPGFIAVQANWTLAAAAVEALTGPDLLATFRELAPRVQDELDPGREFVAGLPLMLSLAYSEQIDDFLQYAVDWNIPPEVLSKQIFFLRAVRGADRLRESTALQGYILAREWTQALSFQTGGWPNHLASCAPKQIIQDILSLTVGLSWHVLPGELADLVGWHKKSS